MIRWNANYSLALQLARGCQTSSCSMRDNDYSLAHNFSALLSQTIMIYILQLIFMITYSVTINKLYHHSY